VKVNITKLIDDVQCYQMVRELRWPDGVQCKLRQHILYLCAKLSRPSWVTGLAGAHLPPRE
jgi:hypothetical protein